MRPHLAVAGLIAAAGLALSSCAYLDPLTQSEDTPLTQELPGPDDLDVTPPAATEPDVLPVDAMPHIPEGKEAWTACPYLDTEWLANTNGQRVLAMGIDSAFDPPACVFWSYDSVPQAQVIVRHMPTREEAIAVVDWAAPVDTTSAADQPAGWDGGRGGDDASSVYAVHKDTTAVVVFSNQGQSVKAQTIAAQVISNLGL